MLSFLFGSKATSESPPQSLVDANTTFAIDLYSQLRTTSGNLFFSPYSISTALAMTYAGARGDTEEQMADALHFSSDQHRLHANFGQLQRQLAEAGNIRGIELSIANALWAQQGHDFRSAFLKIAAGQYQANVKQADFKTSAELARREINNWVSQTTNDKIQNILPPGSLHALTRLVLANAIYFKGAWLKPFERAETSREPFHLLNGLRAEAPLMHHFDEVKYVAENDFQAVELPYGNGDLSMVILLPEETQGCTRLERHLSHALLSRALDRMRKKTVEIFLPRFKLESTFHLTTVLSSMGMENAFSNDANFSGMDGTHELFISGVFHKAWGEVNEEGTEATAATMVAMAGWCAPEEPPPPPVFRADHPFIFLIRDTRSGTILFLGRLTHPIP